MARPLKKGLAYFPFVTDFFNDPKIEDLIEAHKTNGIAIYVAALCIIYERGYYWEGDIKEFHREISRRLHYKVNPALVGVVVSLCVTIGLFDNDLYSHSVITSASIQRRYARIAERRKSYNDEYWLLEKNSNNEALESAPNFPVSATETGVSATETQVNVAEMTQNNKSKITTTNIPTSRTRVIPGMDEIVRCFVDIIGADDAIREAVRFIEYNAGRGWDCLPNWRYAAELWVEAKIRRDM